MRGAPYAPMKITVLAAATLLGLSLTGSAFLSSADPKGYATRTIEGFTVHVEDDLAHPKGGARKDDELGREALALLSAKLLDVRRALPESALASLRAVPIWLDRNDPKFPCAVYHPSETWLRENGCDPRKAKSVHISNAANFLSWSLEQPAMVLHELAHAYHDRMSAADRERIEAAHARAVASKTYDAVLRASGAEDRHYALQNPSEFFAESTEACFGTNDFYPFVHAELVRHDPETAKLLRELWSR